MKDQSDQFLLDVRLLQLEVKTTSTKQFRVFTVAQTEAEQRRQTPRLLEGGPPGRPGADV